MEKTLTSNFVNVDGLNVHYRSAGAGEPVLLLHGFPTSSFLWRHVAPHIAHTNRVIALDLPGFGQSDKPLDVSYSFRFFEQFLSSFLEALELETISLVVHDLGGPIGLYWACQHPDRVRKLALLNTLVYPEFSWAVILFVLAVRLPGLRSILSSPWGLRAALKIGIHDKTKITPEALAAVQAPFESQDARRALIKAGSNLHPNGFRDIAHQLPEFKIPVRAIYGEHDRILPDVAKTLQRVARDLPQTVVSALPDCSHFLQEECPDEVGRLLADFFKPDDKLGGS